MNVYDFRKQLALGQQGERLLKDAFAVRFQGAWVTDATMQEQRKKKLDALLYLPNTKKTIHIEFKTDFLSQKYGNLIYEIVSVDRNNTPGWVYASKAELLTWLCWHEKEVLILEFETVRHNIKRWQRQYKTKKIRNKTYNTIGIAVPLHESRDIAIDRFFLKT